MATVTENQVDAIIDGLEAAVPALAAAQGLLDPGDIRYGEPELTPATQTPYIVVDAGEYRQEEHSIGGGIQREPRFTIYAFIAGPDVETVARHIHRWGDILCTATEGLDIAGLNPLIVGAVDFSPNFRLRGGSALFRAVAIEITALAYRAHGSGP